MYPAQATQAEYELMLFYFLANAVLFLLNCLYLASFQQIYSQCTGALSLENSVMFSNLASVGLSYAR